MGLLHDLYERGGQSPWLDNLRRGVYEFGPVRLRVRDILGRDAVDETIERPATLVVGPFYLARALGLDTALVGIVMSAGPVVAALTGVPAGRLVDRFGAQRLAVGGLAGMVAGASALGLAPATLGIAGYVIPMVILTASYALFQAANNTAVMTDIFPDQRGVISGMLNLSRNLGLITGASLMGAIFALASRTADFTSALPAAVATGMRVTFATAAALVVVALLISLRRLALSRPAPRSAEA